MQVPIPDVANMDPGKFIMWLAAALLVFVLWGVGSELQARRDEHVAILSSIQISCVHGSKTKEQGRECITLKLSQKTLDELH